jgi:hypothetical protein
MQAQAGDGPQVVERDLVRVPKWVADPARDDRDAWTSRRQQPRAGARPRAVVADLEHVHRRQQSALGQQLFDRDVRVPGEQRPEPVEAEQANDRSVVDVALRQWSRHVGRRGIDEREGRRPVESQPRSGSGQLEPAARLVAGQLQEARIGRVGVVAAGVKHHANLVAFEGGHQAGHVVLVRVGEDHHVDVAPPPREPLAETAKQEILIGSAIDQHRRARRGGHQDCVTLPDVQHDEVQPAIGQARHGQGDEQRTHGGNGNPRASEGSKPSRQHRPLHPPVPRSRAQRLERISGGLH